LAGKISFAFKHSLSAQTKFNQNQYTNLIRNCKQRKMDRGTQKGLEGHPNIHPAKKKISKNRDVRAERALDANIYILSIAIFNI
jgi:DNA topoisomerase IA